MSIVGSYLLCGDIASLRGLCNDATAEHGQPEGTGRLENTHTVYAVRFYTERARETEHCGNYPYICPYEQHIIDKANWKCWKV